MCAPFKVNAVSVHGVVQTNLPGADDGLGSLVWTFYLTALSYLYPTTKYVTANSL